ncbi:hypothetical protein [Foetidibacter luteolus]|nr:hypothetical protein [Foetidibacter luteolus]
MQINDPSANYIIFNNDLPVELPNVEVTVDINGTATKFKMQESATLWTEF